MKLALFTVAVLAGCSSSHAPEAEQVSTTEAAKLLIDRNWIDVMPETKHDKLHVYRFVPNMGGGVFQDRTIFKGTFELFRFTVDKDKIHFDLPETDDEVTSRFKIEKVKGPKPFDLKLSISDDPRGPHVYYGVRAETDRSALDHTAPPFGGAADGGGATAGEMTTRLGSLGPAGLNVQPPDGPAD